MEPVYLSYSSLSNFLSCRRKYKIRKLDKIELIKRPTYFIWGTAFHKGVELWMNGMSMDRCKTAVKDVFLKVDKTPLKAEQVESLQVDAVACLAAFVGFTQRYPALPGKQKVVLTEQKEDIRILPATDGLPEVRYQGQIDILAHEHSGEWWVSDYKSTAQIDASVVSHPYYDWQFLGYCFLAKRITGSFPRGVRVHFVQKPSIRQKKTETRIQYMNRTIEWYKENADKVFSTEVIIYNKNTLKEFWAELKVIAEEFRKLIVDATQENFYRNTSVCKQKFGSCEYMPICSSGGKVSKMIYRKTK